LTVCVTEGVGELLGWVGEVVAEALGGEVEATTDMSVSNCMYEEEWLGQRYIPGQPQKTFGGDVLLLL
jgi:hypothetical protein